MFDDSEENQTFISTPGRSTLAMWLFIQLLINASYVASITEKRLFAHFSHVAFVTSQSVIGWEFWLSVSGLGVSPVITALARSQPGLLRLEEAHVSEPKASSSNWIKGLWPRDSKPRCRQGC